IESIDPDAMRTLLDYQWPGNIRELQNVLEYAFVVGQGTVLQLSELPPEFREPLAINNRIETKNISPPINTEKERLEHALYQCNGQVTKAAQLLGMSRATFWRKRKHYDL
ncbi:MAG: AAA family ATPase, partial [Methylococcales bacterium]|nr:AAA family ATPase [Methylococcales bacterium]